MTVTVGRGPTPHQRRESTKERLAVIAGVLDALDTQVAALPPSFAGVEPHGLRRIVRALLPLALDDPGFDVTVTVAREGVGVRVHHDDGKVTARLVPGPDIRAHDPGSQPRSPAGRPPSRVVSELAEALRRGHVRPR